MAILGNIKMVPALSMLGNLCQNKYEKCNDDSVILIARLFLRNRRAKILKHSNIDPNGNDVIVSKLGLIHNYLSIRYNSPIEQ